MERKKIAVVIGATGNLGGAIVKELEAKGFQVDPTWTGTNHPDARDESAYANLPEVIDVAVYTAGLNVIENTENLPLEKWHEVIDTNLTGAFLFAKHAFPGLKKSGAGIFVGISSINATHPYPRRVAYATSKAGLEGMIRELAVEWGQYGIRTHAIRLGHLAGLMKTTPANPKLLDAVKKNTPTGNLINPEDVASYIAWLAEGGSRSLSGCVIDFEPAYTINRFPLAE